MALERRTSAEIAKESFVVASKTTRYEIDKQQAGGGSSKYRGKHRSHTKGKGMESFFRNKWMKHFNK